MSDAVDGAEGPRQWQLGTGVWLLWQKAEPGRGIDRVAAVPGGLWMVTEDGALLEHWYGAGHIDAETGQVVVDVPTKWEMHTGPGTRVGRGMQIVPMSNERGSGWYVN